jgi:hypothetical protein
LGQQMAAHEAERRDADHFAPPHVLLFFRHRPSRAIRAPYCTQLTRPIAKISTAIATLSWARESITRQRRRRFKSAIRIAETTAARPGDSAL